MTIFASGLKLNLNLTLSPRNPPQERLLYTLNKLFAKQVKSFLLVLDLDPFIFQCSPHNIEYIKFTTGVDPGFDQGRGPQIVTGLNCQWCAAVSCEQSEPFSAWGLGPALGPQKLLGISLLNMHSLHFRVPFYTIFEIIKYFLINCPDKLFCT